MFGTMVQSLPEIYDNWEGKGSNFYRELEDEGIPTSMRNSWGSREKCAANWKLLEVFFFFEAKNLTESMPTYLDAYVCM